MQEGTSDDETATDADRATLKKVVRQFTDQLQKFYPSQFGLRPDRVPGTVILHSFVPLHLNSGQQD